MALVLKDRVRESSSTSGTGSITLTGAFTGYQTFASAVTSGSTVYYTIHNTTSPNDGEWEVGVGTFTSPSTLSRDTVFSSSTGGTKVSFSSASTLEVFITQPAEEAVYINTATGKVESNGNGANTISFTNINTTNLTASTVTLTAGTITTNAANATDITNKAYVDGLVAAGIHFHEPVLVESPTALIATYNQPGGAGNGVGATLTNSGSNVALVIDGVTLSNTARVLVYTQSNAVQNGVYTVTNPGNVSAQWVLTRATDADTYVIDSPTGLSEGSTFFVQSGDTGAGETYTCNTTGVITFGTTNINFAQISSAQIYSAGTGLSLTNTTFSISNTAVTAAQYGNDGAVGQFTVNAQGQITNAANVSINASSISVGTLANGRTTAASANGASTIVLRDSNGDFTANTITATTVNAVTGNFSNVVGATLTSAKLGNNLDTNGQLIIGGNYGGNQLSLPVGFGPILQGLYEGNAFIRTGNAGSVNRTWTFLDSDGSFTSPGPVVASSFSGSGSTINSINASNISSGTIDNSRTTAASANGAATIVLRDSSGSFSAGDITANSISGNGVALSAINASNIASGTIANARTTADTANGASTIVLRGASGEFAAGAITGTSFSGNGSAITDINASAITTGTLDNARTTASSSNGASTIVLRDAGGNFSANTVTATTGSFTSVSGNGASLTAINASNISSGTLSATFGGTGSANLTADNVILGNGASTVKVVAPGTANNVLTSNGTTWVSQAFSGGGTVIPSGTVMLFAQTAAPTGFTKLTTQDNKALRVVSGTASTGGSVNFTTAFASQGVSGSISTSVANQTATNQATTQGGSVDSTTLSTAQMPAHAHGAALSFLYGRSGVTTNSLAVGGDASNFGNSFLANNGSSNSHNHGFTGSSHNHTQNAHNHTATSSFTGTAINLAVQYVDVILASKD